MSGRAGRELREELAVAAVDPGGRGHQPLLDLGAVEGVQEELELTGMRAGPEVQVGRVGRAELRQLERQQRPSMAAELHGPDADDRDVEMLGEDRVEFGDAARPRVQVIAGDTVDHSLVVPKPFRGQRWLILHD